MRLKNKVALITGGTSGLGREMAVQFARAGAIAVICGRNSQHGADVVADIQAAGGQAHFIMTDVSQAIDVEAMIAEIIAKFGRLEILVNNAALRHPDDESIETTQEVVWDLVLEVNLKGTFLCCKHALPFLVQSGAGAIVNMGSFGAMGGLTMPHIAYTASKGGIVAMTRELAIAYGPRHVRVNAICPGPIEVSVAPSVFPNSPLPGQTLGIPPTPQPKSAAEVAQVAIFLASDEASHLNGTILMVDSGIPSRHGVAE